MDVFVVIDENGAIAKTAITSIVFEEHEFKEYQNFAGVPGTYLDGFVGVTGETWNNGEVAVITGATMSTNAIKQSTKDVFAAFNSINEGGAQ